MKRVKCPHCGRWFSREERSLFSEQFCRKCIFDRIKASEVKPILKDERFIQVSPGYFICQ